jgi:hypothetical protein
MEYIPDRWTIIELKTPHETVYKVLGSWYGGYLGNDSWRVNSGIRAVHKTRKAPQYHIHGHGGSIYLCGKRNYGMSMYTSGIYQGFLAQATDDRKIRGLDQDEAEKLLDAWPKEAA